MSPTPEKFDVFRSGRCALYRETPARPLAKLAKVSPRTELLREALVGRVVPRTRIDISQAQLSNPRHATTHRFFSLRVSGLACPTDLGKSSTVKEEEFFLRINPDK